jgi:hypothetical protein
MNSTEFYTDSPDKMFRLGDVLKGYIAVRPTIKNPYGQAGAELEAISINLDYPEFVAILTPCCSIEKSLISLAPLKIVNKKMIKNENWIHDMTMVNRKIDPKMSLPSDDWAKLAQDKQRELLNSPKSYALMSLFVYATHDLFPRSHPEHETYGNINYYHVDFKSIYTVHCDKIIRPDKVPIESKILQLSKAARHELREKLAHYFGRIPKEDSDYARGTTENTQQISELKEKTFFLP